jgi:hypothetical protein
MIGFSDDPGAHAYVDLAERSKFETPGSAIAGSRARPGRRQDSSARSQSAMRSRPAGLSPNSASGPERPAPGTPHQPGPCHGPDLTHAQQVLSSAGERSIRQKNHDPRSSRDNDLDLSPAMSVTTPPDISGSTVGQQIPLTPRHPPDRDDHHPQTPSGHAEQLLGSAGDPTPHRGSPHRPRSE